MSNLSWQNLRHQYPSITFENFFTQLTNSDLEVSFIYHIANLPTFTHRVIFENVDATLLKTIPAATLDNLFINLGIVELLSYWKLTCAPTINIKITHLPRAAISFWQKLLVKGMSEYFYTNQIADFASPGFVRWQSNKDLEDLFPKKGLLGYPSGGCCDFSPERSAQEKNQPNALRSKRVSPTEGVASIPSSTTPLVGFGGGKDSLLSGLILAQNFAGLVVHPASPSAAQTFATLNPSPTALHHVHRHFDPQLTQLNKQGFLNGHVPFSASVAFIGNIVQVLSQTSPFIVSNEYSACEDSTVWHDQPINHQYSKSLEFERDFNSYTHQFISPHLHYFSLLRPFFELKIAQLFAQLASPEQLHTFHSCNVGQKDNVWCHHCAKCLFVFTILYPFLSEEVLTTQVFSSNLFADDSLIPLAEELAGLTESKPLECIGTIEEVQCAFYLSIQKYLAQSRPLPPLLSLIKERIIDRQTSWDNRVETLLSSYQTDHLLPPWAVNLTFPLQHLHRLSYLANVNQALILGSGREGLSLFHFLRHFFPRLELTVADKKSLAQWGKEWQQILLEPNALRTIDGDNYLRRLSEFPIIFRSPGIPLTLIEEKLEEEGLLGYPPGGCCNTNKIVRNSAICLCSRRQPCPNLPGASVPRPKQNRVDKEINTEFLNFGSEEESDLIAAASSRTRDKNDALKEGVTSIPSQSNPAPLITSATTLFLKLFSSQIIGVTGTKGKSTTASLIHHLLKANNIDSILVGNIGTPALDHLHSISPDTIIVMELSAHQLLDLHVSPHIAVIQDINPEHLDYYPNFAAYVAAKTPIASLQTATDFVIFNPDFSLPAQIASSSPAQKVPLSFDNIPPAPSLLGEHNLQNVATAVAAARLFHLSDTQISAALATFTPLAHRLQFIKSIHGVDFYNDSLATTPEATLAALNAFPNRPIILLAGGFDRHQDYGSLAATILTKNVPALILFPTTGERLREEIEKLLATDVFFERERSLISERREKDASRSIFPQFFSASSMSAAFDFLKPLLEQYPNAVVLLSPAAASFNIWRDYADRGESFISAVNQL